MSLNSMFRQQHIIDVDVVTELGCDNVSKLSRQQATTGKSNNNIYTQKANNDR